MDAPCLVSEAARRAKATVHQVRTYVAANLVKPCARTAGGYFLFDELYVQRLRLVAAATRAGLRLKKLLLAHIPDKHEHRVRNSGWYSNRARGERHTGDTDSATTLPLDETPADRHSRAHWARLIQKVYAVNPLQCPKCGGTMRLIAVIDEPAVIRRSLKHLRRWHPPPKAPDPPARDPPWPAGTTIPLTYHPVPDLA